MEPLWQSPRVAEAITIPFPCGWQETTLADYPRCSFPGKNEECPCFVLGRLSAEMHRYARCLDRTSCRISPKASSLQPTPSVFQYFRERLSLQLPRLPEKRKRGDNLVVHSILHA